MDIKKVKIELLPLIIGFIIGLAFTLLIVFVTTRECPIIDEDACVITEDICNRVGGKLVKEWNFPACADWCNDRTEKGYNLCKTNCEFKGYGCV